LRGYDARCVRAVHQMLRKNLSGERAEDADQEQGPAACAQSAFPNPLTQTTRARSHQRSETPLGAQTGSLGSPQEIRTGNLDLD
jgi:hypothetical protein